MSDPITSYQAPAGYADESASPDESEGSFPFEALIEEVTFGLPPFKVERGEPSVGLRIMGETSRPSKNLYDHPLFYSCGSGWRTIDDGAEVVKDVGKQTFNKTTRYWAFICYALATEAREEIERRLNSGLTYRHAALWQGLRFRFENREYGKRLDFATKAETPQFADLPVEFLGVGSESPDGGSRPQGQGAEGASNNGKPSDEELTALAATMKADGKSKYDFANEVLNRGVDMPFPAVEALYEKAGA